MPTSTKTLPSPSAADASRCLANQKIAPRTAEGPCSGEGIKYYDFYWYARCSTNESKQDIDRQVRELKAVAVKHQLSSLLEQAQAGDTIITLEISRLARSTKQLCDMIEIVKHKRLRLCVVGSINVDCTSGEIGPMTNARTKGAKIGRPQTTAEEISAVFLRHYPAFKAGRLNLSELARACDLSRTTVYKYIDLLEGRRAYQYFS